MADNKKAEPVLPVHKWTTARVNDIMEQFESGMETKINPFWDGNPDWRAGNIVFEYTGMEMEELRKCAADVIYFANNYCFAMTDDGIQNITLRDYQEDILRNYQNNRFNVFLAPRQCGKTVVTSIFMAWYLLFNTDRNLMIIANNGSTTEELIDKIKVVLSNLPFFMKPGIIVNNVMTMKFDNGCRLFGRTTTKTSGIGFTIHFLYMDEFAHISKNFIDPFYRAVYPTISSSKISRIIITSTPNGLNKFYDIYTEALAGANDYNPIRVDWWQVPGRDEAWRQKEIGNLGSEADFNQEYNNQFLSSSKLLLDEQTMISLKKVSSQYTWHEIEALSDDLGDGSKYDKLMWHPKFDLDSISSDDRFVFSIDTAGGVGGDYTVLNIMKVVPMSMQHILDRSTFRDESDFVSLLQVGLFRCNLTDVEGLLPIFESLLYKVFGADTVRVILEMDFMGNLLYEKARTHPEFYEDIFIHTKHTESAKLLKPGVKLNSKNKLEYCLETKKHVKTGRILPNEKYTIEEFGSFGRQNNGTYASQVGNDDVAMTLVNISPYFMSQQFLEQVEDIYDKMAKKYKDAITKKLETRDDGDGLDGNFLRSVME